MDKPSPLLRVFKELGISGSLGGKRLEIAWDLDNCRIVPSRLQEVSQALHRALILDPCAREGLLPPHANVLHGFGVKVVYGRDEMAPVVALSGHCIQIGLTETKRAIEADSRLKNNGTDMRVRQAIAAYTGGAAPGDVLVLISSDRDFALDIVQARGRGVVVVLIANKEVGSDLVDSASAALTWRDVLAELGLPADVMPQQQGQQGRGDGPRGGRKGPGGGRFGGGITVDATGGLGEGGEGSVSSGSPNGAMPAPPPPPPPRGQQQGAPPPPPPPRREVSDQRTASGDRAGPLDAPTELWEPSPRLLLFGYNVRAAPVDPLPVIESVLEAARDLGIELTAANVRAWRDNSVFNVVCLTATLNDALRLGSKAYLALKGVAKPVRSVPALRVRVDAAAVSDSEAGAAALRARARQALVGRKTTALDGSPPPGCLDIGPHPNRVWFKDSDLQGPEPYYAAIDRLRSAFEPQQGPDLGQDRDNASRPPPAAPQIPGPVPIAPTQALLLDSIEASVAGEPSQAGLSTAYESSPPMVAARERARSSGSAASLSVGLHGAPGSAAAKRPAGSGLAAVKSRSRDTSAGPGGASARAMLVAGLGPGMQALLATEEGPGSITLIPAPSGGSDYSIKIIPEAPQPASSRSGANARSTDPAGQASLIHSLAAARTTSPGPGPNSNSNAAAAPSAGNKASGAVSLGSKKIVPMGVGTGLDNGTVVVVNGNGALASHLEETEGSVGHVSGRKKGRKSGGGEAAKKACCTIM